MHRTCVCLLSSSALSEYTEYEEGNLELELEGEDSSVLTYLSPGLSDDPESHARRRAHRKHMQRARSSESGSKDKSELRRRSSRSDLQRQLSRQVHVRVRVGRFACMCV